ncbi:hypothetical protein [Sphingopyxis sp. BSNA05]|uniref:hypothetical protein n=1 Tax=Sphingopyxis sp. BSNA05 TaxID=1236614 RepID=UPI001565497A|nr:hypothetical protein [Sphingopyxis sp. BSNA05]
MIETIQNLASAYYGPIFCLGLLVVFAWISWRGSNGWPLNCYPMFARQISVEEASGVRLALKNPDGTISWWNPPFHRLVWRFNLEFQKAGINRINDEVEPNKDAHRKLFERVISGLTDKELAETEALLLIFRETSMDSHGNLSVADAILASYPVPVFSAGVS